jgi:hypothetical protein
MKKKSIIMLIATLIIGIVIGAAGMGIFHHLKGKSASEIPTKEKFIQKTVHMLNPDDSQLKQIQPIIDKYSEKAYLYTKDHMALMYSNFNSMYNELMPFLNDKQKEKIEKKLNHIKTEIGK